MKKEIKKIVKKCVIYYFIIGIIIGLSMFIYSLNHNDFKYAVLSNIYYGSEAGIFALIFMPIIIAFVGVLHALLLWYPIKLILKKFQNK
jgi:hypothetical protein